MVRNKTEEGYQKQGEIKTEAKQLDCDIQDKKRDRTKGNKEGNRDTMVPQLTADFKPLCLLGNCYFGVEDSIGEEKLPRRLLASLHYSRCGSSCRTSR